METTAGSIYIQGVVPDSPAAQDGRLRLGDRVVKLNNSSLEEATREEAMLTIQHAGAFVNVTIVRDAVATTTTTTAAGLSQQQQQQQQHLLGPRHLPPPLPSFTQGTTCAYIQYAQI